MPGARSDHGLDPAGRVLRNASTSQLYMDALRRNEAVLAEGGPLVVDTGRFTGRSPKDKFIVREPGSEDRIWWGDVNHPLSEEHFERLRAKVVAGLEQGDVYVVDAFAGADPAHRIAVRVIAAHPYHALFARTMFIEPSAEELAAFTPDLVVFHCPEVEADPAEDGTRSGTFIVLHPSRSEVLIGGTFYAGEIKKSVFTVMNDRLPLEGVMPMHCSANVSRDGRSVAIFFGLSGTGKTTLSADPERLLVGDDEHGWGDEGVFNFEGGCYAKTIRLSPEAEPEIWKASHRFGTILENVVVDERGELDLDDDSKTENTRAAYKLEQIANALPEKRAGHPQAVLFLAADAFGILPPIARLSREQALFYFLSGYTSKLAGTEIGVTEPQPTFSTCFGAPFLPQPPTVYARLLGEKLDRHGASVWLINTGWTGGPFGEGHR
ncbi:MAG: phosphoenolpyruvate carboxykinase (ATP), partial [Thermoleophilia bacterium]|nr:phosphoenolpyruvate carboxykinase (ATP) [Thermoleophilia bacterium]